MANGNQTPDRQPHDDEGGENRPPKPKGFTGFVMLGIVALIIFMVFQATSRPAGSLDLERAAEDLAQGKIEKIKVEDSSSIALTYRKGAKIAQGKGGQVANLALNASLLKEVAELLRDLQAMGNEAREQSDRDTDALLLRLARARDPKFADGQDARADEFALLKRYQLQVGGEPALLVRMNVPPYGGATEDGASQRKGSLQQCFLLRPKTLTDPAAGNRKWQIDFTDLLAYTNTELANQRFGLPAPGSEAITVDLFPLMGKLEFSEQSGVWQSLLVSLVPWLLVIAFLWFFIFRQMRSSGMGNNVLSFGRSRARVANREKSTVTFADVAGIEEAKDEVGEIVEFLKHPGKFARLGGRIPRGILLVGPPGTGKTLLAKAIAGEAEVPFYSICGSDFVEMFVGVGASRVRDLFKQARENSPCIIFLDEIDAVGRRRGAGLGGGHDEREQTLNAILVEMDGFETDTGIIVIAATNRVDVLDPALLRPGRFDREIAVDLPDVKGREAILRVHARRVRMHPSVDLEKIARGTPGFSGAELEAVVNEAAILATLSKKDYVFEEDLEEARDRVRWGRAKTSRIMDPKEQKVTAYHEAGHALVSLLTPGTDPIHKVTIIPRGQALGATMYLPEKDSYSITVGKAKAHLKICFGGRIAEELFFDDYTSGASNDIKQATAIARRMVKEWGMSSVVGPINYGDGDEPVFIGRDMGKQTHFSESTTDTIDAEVRRIIGEAYEETRGLIEANREQLVILADNLLEYEVLTREEIEGLMAGRTVEQVRADEIESRLESERVANDQTPRSQPVLNPKPEPEPKLPPGLAGEGA